MLIHCFCLSCEAVQHLTCLLFYGLLLAKVLCYNLRNSFPHGSLIRFEDDQILGTAIF